MLCTGQGASGFWTSCWEVTFQVPPLDLLSQRPGVSPAGKLRLKLSHHPPQEFRGIAFQSVFPGLTGDSSVEGLRAADYLEGTCPI